jgi:hypothetical protein
MILVMKGNRGRRSCNTNGPPPELVEGAILNVGWMNHGGKIQTERIDRDMALLAVDFLARIIAVRINADPPPELAEGFGAFHALILSLSKDDCR